MQLSCHDVDAGRLASRSVSGHYKRLGSIAGQSDQASLSFCIRYNTKPYTPRIDVLIEKMGSRSCRGRRAQIIAYLHVQVGKAKRHAGCCIVTVEQSSVVA